ncbi:hypothetical protein ACFXMV_08320, partial [Rhodococcus sp. NPDC059179]
AEFAATVCPHDKRGKQYLLVDAIMAIMHGEPYLECSCERDDCSQAGRTALPGRRAPLTQITMDVATLLGLLSRPAYLHGHGLVGPQALRAGRCPHRSWRGGWPRTGRGRHCSPRRWIWPRSSA